jgi:hypothetical protein
MDRRKTAVVAEGMFAGEKPYQLKARLALPLLVRQAMSQEQIFYGPLARELGVPNPRNMNYILGSVGTTLERLGQEWGKPIPPIQSLAINQTTQLPGKGFIEGLSDVTSLTRQQRAAVIKAQHADVFAYPSWHAVLKALGLRPAELPAAEAVEKARHVEGGGEGEAHKALKDRIYHHPQLVKGPARPTFRECEYPLPSGDRLDVYFERGRRQLAVEVKPSTSHEDDVARGLFQCVKYETVLNKWRAWQGRHADIHVVLALGGAFPPALVGLRNALHVMVIDELDAR